MLKIVFSLLLITATALAEEPILKPTYNRDVKTPDLLTESQQIPVGLEYSLQPTKERSVGQVTTMAGIAPLEGEHFTPAFHAQYNYRLGSVLSPFDAFADIGYRNWEVSTGGNTRLAYYDLPFTVGLGVHHLWADHYLFRLGAGPAARLFVQRAVTTEQNRSDMLWDFGAQAGFAYQWHAHFPNEFQSAGLHYVTYAGLTGDSRAPRVNEILVDYSFDL